jgi:hypothetical protein
MFGRVRNQLIKILLGDNYSIRTANNKYKRYNRRTECTGCFCSERERKLHTWMVHHHHHQQQHELVGWLVG